LGPAPSGSCAGTARRNNFIHSKPLVNNKTEQRQKTENRAKESCDLVEPEVAFGGDQNQKETKQNMNTKLKLAIVASALLLANQARATLDIYSITFVDPTFANAAHAVADVNVVNGLAESGSLTIVTGLDAGTTYNLIPDPGNVAGTYTSPLGAFFYDNLVFPNVNPFVDNNGLLFGNGTREVNLYSTGTGVNNYSFWGYTPDGGYAPQTSGGAAIQFVGTAVPEPTTIISGVLMLLPFGASTLRIMRRKVCA
jgi:hypothetical protein